MNVWGIDAAPGRSGAVARDELGAIAHVEAIEPNIGAMTGTRAGWLRVALTMRFVRYWLSFPVTPGYPDLVLIESDAVHGHQRKGNEWGPRLVGAIGAELTRIGVRFALVNPATLKAYAVGGRADKADMQDAARVAGAPASVAADADLTDAWWLSQIAIDVVNDSPLPDPFPARSKYRRKTIDGIRAELNLDPFT